MPWLTSDDWDFSSYDTFIVCVPRSVNYRAAFFGAVYELSRRWNWEQDTGVSTTAEQAAAVGLEVLMSIGKCDFEELADAINNIALSLQLNFSCTCPEGTGTQGEEPPLPEPPVGPGTPWPDEESYLSDKCQVANVMWEQFREVIRLLQAHNVDSLFAGGVSLAVGIVAAILAAGIATAGIGLVVGVVSGIVALLSSQASFSFTSMLSSLDTNKTDIVCALFLSADADEAKAGFIAAVDDGTLTSVEVQVLSLVAVNQFFNQLFAVPASLLAITPTAPVDCDALCIDPCELSFQIGTDGITRRGSGDLTKDGNARTLTAVEDTGAGFWYVVVNVGDVGQLHHLTNCNSYPAGCVHPADNFSWNWSLTSGTLVSTEGGLCVGGSHNAIGTITQGITYSLSSVELIFSGPATISVTIGTPV